MGQALEAETGELPSGGSNPLPRVTELFLSPSPVHSQYLSAGELSRGAGGKTGFTSGIELLAFAGFDLNLPAQFLAPLRQRLDAFLNLWKPLARRSERVFRFRSSGRFRSGCWSIGCHRSLATGLPIRGGHAGPVGEAGRILNFLQPSEAIFERLLPLLDLGAELDRLAHRGHERVGRLLEALLLLGERLGKLLLLMHFLAKLLAHG